MLAFVLVAFWGWTFAQPVWAAPAGTTHYPDLRTIIPTNSFSIVNGPDGREFRYTHLVYDNGPGPLAIQPQYHEASGNYHGVQQLYTHDAAGNWSVVGQVKLADAFIWHAVHGHFHFPLAAFGLYAVAADGGLGPPVAISPKNGFCIDDSYTYDNTVPHAGVAFHDRGGCGDPTTTRGLSVGGADEYDFRDPGQAIPFVGVPDGTYWFHAMSDPNNDVQELDESNNATNVKVTIANGNVTPAETTHPDTTPPAISLTAPSNGTQIDGTVTLTADTPVTFGTVQFLVDGNPVGSATQTASPYTFDWDTTTVADGDHWLAARVTDAQGRTNTSTVAEVTVTNIVPPPPPPGGTLALDGMVSRDGHGAQTTPPLFSTYSGDLLLAFVSSDGPATVGSQTTTVSGGGLTWSLVKRANTRFGTSEIWKAVAFGLTNGLTVTSTQGSPSFDQSITVAAFSGSSGVGASNGAGAASGAPTVSVTTTINGSWVFGVGNDWDRAVGRTLGASQVMHHQWVDSGTGDTFWMQSQQNPTTLAGTVVPINDTAPTNDQWNLAAVEVKPAPTDVTAPQVTVTAPQAGDTIGGIFHLSATASDNVGVQGVRFKVDGNPIGGLDPTPPFTADWDTRTVSDGDHTITAEAVDAAGNTGVSPDVVATVDNSAPPPAVISIDKLVSKRRMGVLTTPPLSTSEPEEQLVAFVAYDGPHAPGSQQATVSGGGLTWSLVKRSNTQPGDAEIWTARATGTLSNAVVKATPQRTGYDGLLTVIAYRNASGVGVAGATGARSGAPDIYLPGIPAASWVFAVGNDPDRAVVRRPIDGQVLHEHWRDTRAGATFWVQSPEAPSIAPGLVSIHDDAPVTDRWNYAAVEVTPSPGP